MKLTKAFGQELLDFQPYAKDLEVIFRFQSGWLFQVVRVPKSSVRHTCTVRLLHDHEWVSSTLRVALETSAFLMERGRTKRKNERAVPQVSRSKPTRASLVSWL
ncbi:hypothetical protein SGLAM104S_03648 [Streptomyces glaucescens]